MLHRRPDANELLATKRSRLAALDAPAGAPSAASAAPRARGLIGRFIRVSGGRCDGVAPVKPGPPAAARRRALC